MNIETTFVSLYEPLAHQEKEDPRPNVDLLTAVTPNFKTLLQVNSLFF